MPCDPDHAHQLHKQQTQQGASYDGSHQDQGGMRVSQPCRQAEPGGDVDESAAHGHGSEDDCGHAQEHAQRRHGQNHDPLHDPPQQGQCSADHYEADKKGKQESHGADVQR